MHKIVGITDKNGNSKDDSIDYIKANHSLYGELRFPMCPYFIFIYDDDSNKMLSSSNIVNCDFVEDDKLYVIETLNSIYYIKEVENYEDCKE